MQFAEEVRDYVGSLPKNTANYEYGVQLIRSSGSVAANYIEANESLGKRDFAMKMKICRKEAKESYLWLHLSVPSNMQTANRDSLLQEATELKKIFHSIIQKSV